MTFDRRDFMAISSAAAAAASLPAAAQTSSGHVPWHQKVRRVGQVNITEHDPAVMDVNKWADYWASLKVDAVLVSITGIVAYYPSNVPQFRPAKFLNGRDFAGECIAALKQRNIRAIARFSPDLNWREVLEARPEWFKRDKAGNPVASREEPELFETCTFTSYFTEHMPAIMREVNSRYPVDGFYTNGWPPIGRMPECYCAACKNLPHFDTVDYWDAFTKRALEMWRLWDGIAKEKSPDNLYFGNMGGAIASSANMKSLQSLAWWYNCDNQGRGGGFEPVWGASLQGRVCDAMLNGRTATNVTGSYTTGSFRWRNIHKSSEEARMWMNETVASGMVPWYHFIGAEEGLGADRRWQQPGREFFTWLAKHDPHFTNKATIADIAVVMGQRTQRFYKPEGLTDTMAHIHGLYQALLEGRFIFDFLHEEDLPTDKIKKYKTLILPNIALLSDAELAALERFVAGGGSVMASFETGLYDDRNNKRAELGIANLFGIKTTGPHQTRVGNGFMARIERQHPLLQGFSNTDWLPGAQYLLPLAPVGDPVLTVIPPFVNYPPELAYPPVAKTDMPAVVVKEQGASRLVYFACDIERTAWNTGNTDLARLLQNAVRWVSHGSSPVTVTGKGLMETFVWETRAGYAVHLLNYTNPAAFKGYFREYYAIGPQQVSMAIPAGRRVTRVELLRAGKDLPFQEAGGRITFTVPSVLDYEAAALHSA
jgi:hypothetical protein